MLLPLFADVAAVSNPPPAESAPARAGNERVATPYGEQPVAHAEPERPPRGEIHVSYGFQGGASNWSGDGVGYGAIVLGFRLFGTVTPYAGAALGYGFVDERLLTRLTVGVDVGHTFGRWRPHVFAAFVHQHEESLAAVAQQPFGAVLGIGVGIRHRAGVHAGIGLDWVFRRRHNYDIAVGPEVSFMWLTYSSGPDFYIVGGVTISAHFRLL